jgi:hypothetical protein
MEVASELIAELNAELITELKARVGIRQPKELEMFDSLRLSAVVAAEVLTEVEAMDADRKNSYVIGAQSLMESIRALLLR